MNQKEILKLKNCNGVEECLQWAHLLGTVRKELVNLKVAKEKPPKSKLKEKKRIFKKQNI